ncbi:peptidase family C50-domain-containing protein [Phlebopus sp. FC_14]|nr:peptidase family C50-domain-containing protein [Phlebopus sp. FC_14]
MPSAQTDANSAMRAVNASLQTLSAVAESGWKATTEDVKRRTSSAATKVESATKSAVMALDTLRRVHPRSLDVERAACSISGKLLVLEMYDESVLLLADVRPRLLSLIASPRTESQSQPSPLHLLSLPLSTSETPALALVLTFLTHSLHALLFRLLRPAPSFSSHALISALWDTPCLLAWVSSTTFDSDNVPGDTRDAVLKRTYSLITKACASPQGAASASDPKTIFRLRIYALACLLYTTAGTVQPSNFWEQVQKTCISYARASSVHDSDNEPLTAASVSESLSDLVKRAKSLNTHGFLECRSFVKTCEMWMKFAKTVTSAVDELTAQVAKLELDPKQRKSQNTNVDSAQASRDTALLDSSQLCALLFAAIVSLENNGEIRLHCVIATNGSSSPPISCDPTSISCSEVDEEVLRARGKLDRTLEQLRRTAIRLLDPQRSRSSHFSSLLLAEMYAHQTANSGRSPAQAPKDVLASFLDASFILARVYLNPSNVDSYTPALRFLEQGTVVVEAALSNTIISASICGSLLRCISGTLHNLGGTLYTAGRHGGAVRFLKEGCALGRRALDLRAQSVTQMENLTPKETSDKDVDDERDDDSWKQLEQQLFRRYELLGLCYTKIGERKLAYGSFIESVRIFPYIHFTSIICPRDPFVAGPHLPLQQLVSIIERLTYIGTCELFLPPAEISLRHVLRARTSPAIPLSARSLPVESEMIASITGAVLGRQLATLENLIHKEGVRETMGQILCDLLSIYEPNWAPLKRAGVLVSALGILWRDSKIVVQMLGTEENQSAADKIGAEILELLSCGDATSDPSSASLIAQYSLSVHLWLALYAYRHSTTTMLTAVTAHVGHACRVLGGLLPSVESRSASNGDPSIKRASETKMKTSVMKKGRPAARATAKAATITGKTVQATRPSRSRKGNLLHSIKRSPTVGKDSLLLERTHRSLHLTSRLSLGYFVNMNMHLLGLLGLTLLKVKLLETLRRFCEYQTPIFPEAYLTTCVELAQEYIKLGKPKRAGSILARCRRLVKAPDVPNVVRQRYLLGYAEVLALGDNAFASASLYCEAQELEAVLAPEESSMPTVQRIRTRVERLERAALACRIFAAIQYTKDNLAGALSGMLQSLRLWNRAVAALSRVSPPPNSPTQTHQADSNPFEVSSEPSRDQPSCPSPFRSAIPTDAQSWRLLSSLLSTLLCLAQSYFARGSPREALYFTQQALDVAQETRTPTIAARALIIRGEVQLMQGELKAGKETLESAAQLLEELPGIEAADVQRLKGDYGTLCGDEEDPRESYDRAWKILLELEGLLAIDGSRRKSSIASPGDDAVNPGQGMVVPRLLSNVLCRKIWLLRNDRSEVCNQLIDQLMTLPHSVEIRGEQHAIMGKLALHSVYEQFRTDMFLSSVTESTIVLPLGRSGDEDLSLATASQEILRSLAEAEELFSGDLALTLRNGTVPHVRGAAVSLAVITALQASLGKACRDGPLVAARLLDASSAITLHREMVEVIQQKLPKINAMDDLRWPSMVPESITINPHSSIRASPSHHVPSSRSRLASPVCSDVEIDSCATDISPETLTYWLKLQEKYNSLIPSSSNNISSIPHNWAVIHISLTSDKSNMLVSRLHTCSESPVLFSIPLRGRRDGDVDGAHLTLDDAFNELRDIVRLSDEGTRRATHVRNDDPQARAAWWAERMALDKRLEALLDNVEFCWLGAFKTILSPPQKTSLDVIDDLRTRLERVFKRSLPPQDKKKSKPRLDDTLLTCFSCLSPKCRDEELEDLVYFLLDLYQIHGVPVAISDVDVDQITVDLRTALEEHAAARQKRRVIAQEDSHIFLVLDKNVQGIPWESLPVLRGQSVSRIPSLQFLLDRLQFAECQRRANGDDCTEGPVDRIRVDPRKVYYFLNPSGDLKGTEGRFASWLKEMHEFGWEGLTGRAPSEQQFLNALSRKDLVIYFGHGGGEQYARSHKIRTLSRCAPTMLWGCSSGAMKDMGEFDRVGTPNNYMLAGCPTLVANLWDVTDRDIDKFTQGVFDLLRLTPEGVRRFRENRDVGTSVVAAVARSRNLCKLKYLTGAAPVVYGIPFYL